MMWVSHNIVLLFLAWTIEVLTFRQSEGIRTNDHSVIHKRLNKAISEDTWKWHRSYGRKIDGKGFARGYARGLTLTDGVNTSINNKSGKFKTRRITTGGLERVGYQDAGTATANSAATKIGESHKKFYSKKLAAMETAGGGYYSSKPHVMTKRNSRRKRDSIYNQNRTVKSEQKGSNKIDPSSLLGTFLGSPQTIWEPMPRPLALNQSTDFPFDMTRHFFTFLPDGDLEETTPLIPLRTRGKNNLMNNPFYPVTSESYGAYAVMCVSVIIFTVGIIGNMSILCIVCHNYYMRSISNSLLANLALWDFVIVFFCSPLVTFHELTKTWLLGEFSCKIIPYLEVASLGVTTFTLCALCIDRFRAATNVQMYYEMIENCASTSAKLAVIWVGALLLALPELLLRELEVEELEPAEGSRRERCVVRVSTQLPDTLYVLGLTYDSARLWWYFGCFFCLPTLFTIGSSLATARKIRQAERASVRGNKKQIRLESQMNCTVVALAILYGLCIVPENICNIVTAYMAAGVPRRSMELLNLVSQLLLFCKSAVTPVLLLCLCRPFSRAVLDCCCCCCAGCDPARSTGASDDVDHECTTELELSPFSTIRREMSTYTSVGTHC